MRSDTMTQEKKFRCSNPDCGKAFEKPKIIKLCPFCYADVQEEETICQHWFGYLGQTDDGNGILPECDHCDMALECLLKKRFYSSKAVREIKKWFLTAISNR